MDRTVPVGGVDPVPWNAVVLVPERLDVRHDAAREVDAGHPVVLLEGHPRRLGVARNRNVLGLHVLDRSGSRPEHPDSAVEHLGEGETQVDLGDDSILDAGRDVDHGDRAFGVVGVIVARLALIGSQNLRSVWGERHHVRQGTRGIAREEATIEGRVERDQSRILLRLGLDCDHDEPILRVDAVRTSTAGCRRDIDSERFAQIPGSDHVESDDLIRARVDEKQPLGLGVVGHDLGTSVVEDAGLEPGEILEPDDVGQRRNRVHPLNRGGENGRRHPGRGDTAAEIELHLMVLLGEPYPALQPPRPLTGSPACGIASCLFPMGTEEEYRGSLGIPIKGGRDTDFSRSLHFGNGFGVLAAVRGTGQPRGHISVILYRLRR